MAQGHNPEELFKQGAQKKLDKAADQTRAVKEALFESQAAVEGQVGPLIKEIAALDVTSQAQESVQASQEKFERLQATQHGLQHSLDDKQKALAAKVQGIAKLRGHLGELTETVRQMPPAGCPDVVVKIGDAAIKHMSQP